jgi:microcystin degradation protein MlrC
VEGETLRRIRGIEYLSEVPICSVLDTRTNLIDAMTHQSDGLVAYRETHTRTRGRQRATRRSCWTASWRRRAVVAFGQITILSFSPPLKGVTLRGAQYSHTILRSGPASLP